MTAPLNKCVEIHLHDVQPADFERLLANLRKWSERRDPDAIIVETDLNSCSRVREEKELIYG